MDFKGQKSGGTNSNGTNLVPDSGLMMSQNALQGTHTDAQNSSNSLHSKAVQEPGFSAQSSPNPVSNDHNDRSNVALSTSTISIAEDGDLIEKEWVLKAKTIVENTQNNPYLQSQKLSELRTEYLQKRYGKSLQEDA